MYGPFTNERLVGRTISDRRDDVFLATKFGIKLLRENDLLARDRRPPRVRARGR